MYSQEHPYSIHWCFTTVILTMQNKYNSRTPSALHIHAGVIEILRYQGADDHTLEWTRVWSMTEMNQMCALKWPSPCFTQDFLVIDPRNEWQKLSWHMSLSALNALHKDQHQCCISQHCHRSHHTLQKKSKGFKPSWWGQKRFTGGVWRKLFTRRKKKAACGVTSSPREVLLTSTSLHCQPP